jgi:hypothetical protein
MPTTRDMQVVTCDDRDAASSLRLTMPAFSSSGCTASILRQPSRPPVTLHTLMYCSLHWWSAQPPAPSNTTGALSAGRTPIVRLEPAQFSGGTRLFGSSSPAGCSTPQCW